MLHGSKSAGGCRGAEFALGDDAGQPGGTGARVEETGSLKLMVRGQRTSGSNAIPSVRYCGNLTANSNAGSGFDCPEACAGRVKRT